VSLHPLRFAATHHAGAYPVQIRVIGSSPSSVRKGIDGEAETWASPSTGCLAEADPKTNRSSRKSRTLKKDRLHTNRGVVALEPLRLNG